MGLENKQSFKMIKEFKEDLMKTFEMTNLVLVYYFLSIKVSQME